MYNRTPIGSRRFYVLLSRDHVPRLSIVPGDFYRVRLSSARPSVRGPSRYISHLVDEDVRMRQGRHHHAQVSDPRKYPVRSSKHSRRIRSTGCARSCATSVSVIDIVSVAVSSLPTIDYPPGPDFMTLQNPKWFLAAYIRNIWRRHEELKASIRLCLERS